MKSLKESVHVYLHTFKTDFKHIVKDSGVLMILFGASFFYPLVYSTAYSHETVTDVPVAVVDQSQTKSSRALTNMLDATSQMSVTLKTQNFDEAKDFFYDDKVHGIIVIPRDFERKIYRGEQTVVVAYADATYFMIYKQILGGAATVTGTMGAKIEVGKLMQKGMELKRAMGQSQPVSVQTRYLFNPSSGYATYAMPGILILILQQVLLLSIGMLGGTNSEKNRKYFFLENSLDPRHAAAILWGKVSAFLSLHLINVIFMLVIVYKMFGFPQKGALLDIAIFLTPYLLSVAFLGVSIATLIKKRENSLVFLFFTSIPFIFLSGFSYPASEMPWLLQKFSLLIPSTSAMLGFLRLNTMGASLHQVSSEFIRLLVLASGYFILAFFVLRYRIIKNNKELSESSSEE